MKKFLLFVMACIVTVNVYSQVATTVTTNAATGVTYNQATLNGVITVPNFELKVFLQNNRSGALATATFAFFQYGLTTAYGTTVIADQVNHNDTTGVYTIAKTITGLTPNTTYHFRAIDSIRATDLIQSAKNDESKELLIVPQVIYGNDTTFTTGAAPSMISVSLSNIDFGQSGFLTANRDTTIIITNSSSTNLNINSILFSSGISQFQIISNIPKMILANGIDSIRIRLKTDNIGSFTNQLIISNNSVNNPSLSISLRGTIVPINTSPSLTQINFDTTTTIKAKDTLSFILTNNGTQLKRSFFSVISILNKTITGDTGSFHFIKNNQNVTLGPGQKDTSLIEFYPRAFGNKSAVLVITTNDPLSPQLFINMNGVCSGSPKISTSSTLNFGELKYNGIKDTSIILRNAGNLPLSVIDISIKGNDADNFTILSNNKGKILENNQIDTIKVRYYGKLPIGNKSAQIQITSNDNSQNPYIVNLSGFYRTPILNKPYFRLYFDSINVGQNINTTVPLGNIGNDTLRIGSLFLDGPYFEEFSLSTLPGNIIPGGQYGVNVVFNPFGPGMRYARIAIQSNDPIYPEASIILIGYGKSTYYLAGSQLIAAKNGDDVNNTTLIWKKVKDAGSYNIEIGVDTNFNNSIKYASINDTQKIIPGLDINKKYYFRVQPQNNYIIGSWSEVSEFIPSKVIFTEETKKNTPAEIRLNQNYPNPFNPSTMISYQLPMNNYVTLKIYDLMGRDIVTLVSENQLAGYHEVVWNATGVPSGIYYYKLQTSGFVDMKKLILLK